MSFNGALNKSPHAAVDRDDYLLARGLCSSQRANGLDGTADIESDSAEFV